MAIIYIRRFGHRLVLRKIRDYKFEIVAKNKILVRIIIKNTTAFHTSLLPLLQMNELNFVLAK